MAATVATMAHFTESGTQVLVATADDTVLTTRGQRGYEQSGPVIRNAELTPMRVAVGPIRLGWILGIAALLVFAGVVRAFGPAEQSPSTRELPATFVGAAACSKCHERNHEEWVHGRHSKMLQPASPASVLGDFQQKSVTLHGSRYGLRVEDGQFFIVESYLTGRQQEHRVQYTLGSRRVQHYLTTDANGRIIILPPSWDVQRQEWFHNMDIVRPDESTRTPVQQWNRGCIGCHVSQEIVNYDPLSRAYSTQWTDFGTSCERCHGPGSAHVELYAPSKGATLPVAPQIVRPTRLDAERGTAVCGQCHSLRGVMAPDFRAGADYYDYFKPVLEYEAHDSRDPSYWVDGRPRRFSNDAIGLWESQCFLRGGATCTNCHTDPHLPDVDRNPQLAPTNNTLCTQCHVDIGKNVAAHTRHLVHSLGSSCVECHMPKTVVGVKATMRDHTISLPVPENTVAFGIPNACTGCHIKEGPSWAVGVVGKWWPQRRRQKLVVRAQTFAAARLGSQDAVAPLIAIVRDRDQGPLIQANAVGYLGSYSNPLAVAALIEATRAEHPAIRLAAVSGLKVSGSARAALARGLRDPRRAVRVSALGSLIKAGPGGLEPDDEQRFLQVAPEFMAIAHLYEDDARVQSATGVLQILIGQFDGAAVALSNSLELEPSLPSTRFLLALARLGQGRYSDARVLMMQVPHSDPMYGVAQQRLRELDSMRR